MGWEHERLRKSLARGKLILPGPAVLMPTRSPAERKRVSWSGRVTAKMTGGRVCVCGARVGEGGKGESKDLWIANTGTVFSGFFFFLCSVSQRRQPVTFIPILLAADWQYFMIPSFVQALHLPHISLSFFSVRHCVGPSCILFDVQRERVRSIDRSLCLQDW